MAQNASATGASPPVPRQQLRRWKLIDHFTEDKAVGKLMHSADAASWARQEGVSGAHVDKIKLLHKLA